MGLELNLGCGGFSPWGEGEPVEDLIFLFLVASLSESEDGFSTSSVSSEMSSPDSVRGRDSAMNWTRQGLFWGRFYLIAWINWGLLLTLVVELFGLAVGGVST